MVDIEYFKRRQKLIELRFNPYHDPSTGRFCSGGGRNSGLTNAEKSVTMKAGAGYKPYPDKPIEYFSSQEYRDKFKEFGDNPLVTNAMYECAKNAIRKNYNGDGEDAYVINSFIGTHGGSYHGDGLKVTCHVPKKGQYVLVHNHPNNTPLSLDDIVAASDKKQLTRIIAASHDGKIYYLEIGNGRRLSEIGISQKAKDDSPQKWDDFEFRVWGKYVKLSNGDSFNALKLMNEKEGYGWKVGVIE